VFPYSVPEGKSGQQVVDQLQKQVELLGAIKAGNFLVDCETYMSSPNNATQRTVHILHNSEQPATCFSVLDTGTILVADLLYEDMMSKLTATMATKTGRDSFFSQRKGFKIESRGQRYEWGDFIIKIGSVSLQTNFKGILVEVEYCPCVVPNDCWGIIKEISQTLIGMVADSPPGALKNKMDSIFTPSDTIYQYLEHFNNFRKSAATTLQPNR
ncbi:hypothetical protein FSP39_021394, partial [Pinctada imbricata]